MKNLAHGAKDRVAGRMTKLVVVLLESVDVEHDEG
jgi:hypothetical protein